MAKYRVVATGGIDYQGIHYDYGTLIMLPLPAALAFLEQELIVEVFDGDPPGKSGPNPEEGIF